MKKNLKKNKFKPWGKDYLYEVGIKKIYISFKSKNKKQLELLSEKYSDFPEDINNFYSKHNGITYTLQGRSRNIDEAKICSLNEMFDKFKEEATPFPDNLNLSKYNDDFDLQDYYLKKENPFFGKLYSPEDFEGFNTLEEVKKANILRRVKKIAPIFGYDDDIVIDLKSKNKNGYQMYLLSGRSGTGEGIYPMSIDFVEFIHYFLLFGFVGHWYIAFIPKASFSKKYLKINKHIKELEKHFSESPIHRERLNNIILKFNKFK
ncbi:hypothetical protein [Aquimarina spinulae]|uniref:hypothetical protein n=1 Tax=Aquimarina spinulae TaxID=1192023 RepID=UPI000D56281C|nr:hypothetical protein [Aquimarina spinulae]